MTGSAQLALALERFAWEDGSFEVAGRWTDATAPSGRARLVIELDGRRRRLTAHGAPAHNGSWRARFPCPDRPRSVGAAELEVGEVVVDLPAPEVGPERPPDVRGAEGLLQQLREERAALEAAADRLAHEREEADAAVERLAQMRTDVEGTAMRRAAARRALERPVEPRRVVSSRLLAYGLAVLIVIVTALLLALVL